MEEATRIEAGIRLLEERYSGSMFSWSISQKNGVYFCLLTRISDRKEARAGSTNLPTAIENVLGLGLKNFGY